jgi:hypothetical protein
MMNNRWLLFGIFFISILIMRLIFLSDLGIAEQLFNSFFTAALLAYLDKYMKRFMQNILQRIFKQQHRR